MHVAVHTLYALSCLASGRYSANLGHSEFNGLCLGCHRSMYSSPKTRLVTKTNASAYNDVSSVKDGDVMCHVTKYCNVIGEM